MIILATFLAGMSFVIAVAACVSAQQERERAQSCERALNAAMTEQAAVLATLAKNDGDLEALIRAVAAASTPPDVPIQRVRIMVPGPRRAQ